MSQLLVTPPNPFFEKPKSFPYVDNSTSTSNYFQMPQADTEIEKFLGDYSRSGEQSQLPYLSFDQSDLVSLYSIFSNAHFSFSTEFPRAQDYLTRESILKAFPHLETINDYAFDINAIPSNAQFYIVRSSNDDNIHKAIKYHLWSTTTSGKAALSTAWKDSEKQCVMPEIYLIFSVVNSHHFLGVARMRSDIQHEETFMHWWEPLKWFGSFQLEWLFVKDVHSSKFEHIKEESFGSTAFINLKDCTKLSSENGKEVLKIFRDLRSGSDIFTSFAYMDQREDCIRSQRENNTYFLKCFEKCCTAYKKDPEGFITYKKFQASKKGIENINGDGFGLEKQNNVYYRKVFYGRKQQFSPKHHENNQGSKKNFEIREDGPSVSLVEQFGLKVLKKKSKTTKHQKPEVEKKTDRIEETEQDKL